MHNQHLKKVANGKIQYHSFEDIFQNSNKETPLSTSNILGSLKVLFEFHSRNGRLPIKNEDGIAMANLLKEMNFVIGQEFFCEFLDYIGKEINATSAAVGAVIGQEIIKAITHVERPIENFMYMDMKRMDSVMEILPHN